MAYYVLLVELSGFSRTSLANDLTRVSYQLGLLSNLESNIESNLADGSMEADPCQARGEILPLDRSKVRQDEITKRKHLVG